MDNTEKFNYKNLSALKGELLLVEDNQGNSLTVTVSNVNKGSAHSDNYESFATYLKDEQPQRIPQGNYLFSHPDIGLHYLFCSAKSANDYEIIINRDATTK